ncbi:mating type protein MAT-1-2 [Gaeumannomyces avenae]
MSTPEADISQMEVATSVWVIVKDQITQDGNTNNIAHIATILFDQLDETSKKMLLSWFRIHSGINEISFVRDIKARRYYIGPTFSFEQDFQVVMIQGVGAVWLWDLRKSGQDVSINSCNISDETACGFNKIRFDRTATGTSTAMMISEVSGGESFSFGAGYLDEASSPDTVATTDHLDSIPSSPIGQTDHHHAMNFGLVNPGDSTSANIVEQLVYNGSLMSPSQVFDSGMMQQDVFQPTFAQQNIARPNLIHPSIFQSFSAPATSLASSYAGLVASAGFTMQSSAHAMPNGSTVNLSLPTQTEPQSNNVAQDPKPQKEEKIPRPPNAYILYRKEFHATVKANNPGIHNNMISVILGKQWANETPVMRSKYKKMADDIKRKLHEKHPDYRYTPRRSSEIIRRRTNRQATAAAAATEAKETPN